jgi:hypothetical protein
MDSTTNIFLAVIFSAIGMGYIVYGKKQQQAVALICGVALCAYQYFISNTILVITIGIALMLLPFYLRN